jgi:kynureninase
MAHTQLSLKELQEWDATDSLARVREEFSLPEDTIYLDGNSLGALPNRVQQRVSEVTNVQWGQDLIRSWNTHAWVDLPQRVGQKIAPLLGASSAPDQVVCCDSISVNVFKLLAAAMTYHQNKNNDSQRIHIVSSQDNFPTDLYIAQGLQELLGNKRCQFVDVPEDELMNTLDDTTAVLMVTQVNFRTGRKLDIPALTQQAHKCGALILVDLAHSAGVLPLKLDEWKVDMAVGCTYKNLNGGPGAPAFLYVNQRLHSKLQQPIAGWFGHVAPFQMDPTYVADAGIKKFLAGTPSIISMAAADAALEIYDNIDMTIIRNKSIHLTTLFHKLMEQTGLSQTLQLISPTDATERGSQLSYAFEYAYELCQALIARNVIADFRAPNYIRFGLAPLYLRYQDVWHAVHHILDVIESQDYKDPQWAQRHAVT